MRIRIVTHAPATSRTGNRVTADRWARILRSLGHVVSIDDTSERGACDLLIALHAKKSAIAVLRSKRESPRRPVVLTLTGTDVYHDIRGSKSAQRAMSAADRLVVFQPLAIDELSPTLRRKARVVYQSVRPTRRPARRASASFQVLVLGHLRPVKDPFRAALAARRLSPASRIRIVHAGRALSPAMARRARAEERRNPRYRWVDGVSRPRAMAFLAQSDLLVLSSRSEGGANVIGEALAHHIPVVASRIPGSVGLLGRDYPGYYPFGDSAALAKLLARAERDPAFLRRLRAAGDRRAALFAPNREARAWAALIDELLPRTRRGSSSSGR